MMIKVCGITRREDALAAVDAGASALGFIFYPQSPRYVTPSIAAALGEGLATWKVGVFVDEDPESLATRVWPEVCAALNFGPRPLPIWRVVKEKRATFAATPEQESKRPGADLGLTNMALAGDFTRTGLPATIEGAIRSGRTAANLLLTSSRTTHAA